MRVEFRVVSPVGVVSWVKKGWDVNQGSSKRELTNTHSKRFNVGIASILKYLS